MERLRFVKTMSVSDFKIGMGISEIEVKKNPHTGKLFFVFGDGIGAVSERFEEDEITSPVISQVCSSDTGENILKWCNSESRPDVINGADFQMSQPKENQPRQQYNNNYQNQRYYGNNVYTQGRN